MYMVINVMTIISIAFGALVLGFIIGVGFCVYEMIKNDKKNKGE